MKNNNKVMSNQEVFILAKQNDYSLEQAFESVNGFNPNYRAQADLNSLLSNIFSAQITADKARDKFVTAMEDGQSQSWQDTLQETVFNFDNNLDKLEINLDNWKALDKERKDLELKFFTNKKDLEAYKNTAYSSNIARQQAPVQKVALDEAEQNKIDAITKHRSIV